MQTPAPILIAGGGIGGLALALALARKNFPSIVLERREDFQTAGAGIQLGPNGVRVLQGLGLAEAMHPLVGEPDALMIRSGRTAAHLARLPLGKWIAARHGAPYWVAHRGDLHRTLIAAATGDPHITLRMGFEVATLAQTAATVTATSTDGEAVTAPALVAADGLWSRVRHHLYPASLPDFAGATATRTVIPAARAGVLAVNEVGLWLTPGTHVVHYPVRSGTEIAVVIIARESSWQVRGWDAPGDPCAVAARLSGFAPPLREALAAAPEWRRWALFRLPPLPRWSYGRITLMGDAAHPMLPYLAQGGVLALEDALVLADALAATDATQALRAYENRRHARATRVQAASLRQGRLYHLPPPFSWGRDSLLRLMPGAVLMSSLDWMYGWTGGPPRP
jgi:salicylate hydroxylase